MPQAPSTSWGASVAELSLTVVMPTYNRANYIDAALDSLAAQARVPDEVIVVDDCSTDDTALRVARHPFVSRIRYHRQLHNAGASIARNLGVELARGQVIVFLDSDDLLEPEHHRAVLDLFSAQPSTGLFCCDAKMIGIQGELLSNKTFTEVQTAIKGIDLRSGPRSLVGIFAFSTSFPGMAVRRGVYRAVGGLDQELFPLDDFELQLKVAAAGYGVHYEHRSFARYRVHGANESGPERGVRVGRQKLRCVRLARHRYTAVRALGWRARRRQGEVRRELAFSLWKARDFVSGLRELALSLLEDPWGVSDIARVAGRRIARPR